ncbi:hypothetical protein [Pseudomonas sp. MF6768]|uniref:hypothetical protein n=1 Tax=Pseudomonas sp. MF6768 TaxID=2797532 RepID=UPI0018E7A40B|nr:hypothetical protein [Pseudomonas sp. MF6768]MBJ2241256.1 hypothetical protein [Pseudomonas sp. MF6768]
MTKPVNVEKATPTILYAKQAPYASVSNDVVAMISNPDALAIWIYLQTRSSDWKVIGSYLQDRFSIGRERYSKAMGYLKEIGLVTHEIMRDEATGKVLGRRVIVHYEPNLQVSHTSVDRSVGFPNCGETDSYLIKDSSTQSSSEPTVANAPPLAGKPKKFDPLNAKPENVSAKVWADWCQHRKEIRKPLTATTCAKQAETLSGHSSPDDVINNSISNGWTGLFPAKLSPATSGKSSSYNNLPQHTADMYQGGDNGPAF